MITDRKLSKSRRKLLCFLTVGQNFVCESAEGSFVPSTELPSVNERFTPFTGLVVFEKISGIPLALLMAASSESDMDDLTSRSDLLPQGPTAWMRGFCQNIEFLVLGLC